MQQSIEIKPKPLLTREEAAIFLTEQGYPTAKSTLAKLACIGGGPKFRKYGKRVLSTREELIEWAKSRLSEPLESTSQGGAA